MRFRAAFLNCKLKYVVGVVVVITLVKVFGLLVHLYEQDYLTEFSYPYEGNVERLVHLLKNDQIPDVDPINYYNFSFISNCEHKCKSDDLSQLRLVFLVKSALGNFNKRKAIRKTWGYESRFSDVEIRTVFVLGRSQHNELQNAIEKESLFYNDIVQANFEDTYFNNTLKTMMGIKWAVTFCPKSKFYMFVDDDYYVSTKNLLSYIRNPTEYPRYLQTIKGAKRSKAIEYDLPDKVQFYSGYVFFSAPHRHMTSKWYVSLEDYPFNLWPPYVTAGAYVLSHETLVDFYYASFYTKHFKFDDIYIGLIAKKMDVEPFHSDHFHFHKQHYTKENYQFTIASHGYEPDELVQVWYQQKEAGNA